MAPAASPEKICCSSWCIAAPSIAEIGAADLRIVGQRLGGSGHDDVTGFEEVGLIGQFQRERRVLFDQEHRDVLLAPYPLDDGKNVLDDARSKSERGFVEY